jgi:drug/metabolite transporter superfamily protein YnfA
MQSSEVYIVLILASLLIISVLFLLFKFLRESRKSSMLIGLAVVFMITGFLLDDQKMVGNSLLGIGIMLSLIDVFTSKIRSDN